MQHRWRLLEVRIPQHQADTVTVRISGNNVEVQVTEQQHLPREASLELIGPLAGSIVVAGKLAGKSLEPLLTHCLGRILADRVALGTLHHFSTNPTNVVLERGKTALLSSLLDCRLILLRFLQCLRILKNLSLTSLSRQQPQTWMCTKPIPFTCLAEGQRHADHLVGQISRNNVSVPLDRQHDVTSSLQIDLPPLSTPWIVTGHRRLPLQFEINNFQPLKSFGQCVKIQGALELLGLVLEHHQPANRHEVVSLGSPDTLIGVVDRSTITTTETAVAHRRTTGLSHRIPTADLSRSRSRWSATDKTTIAPPTHRRTGIRPKSVSGTTTGGWRTFLARRH